MMKIFPGLRFMLDGRPCIIARVYRAKTEHVMLYQDGDVKHDPPIRAIVARVRVDLIDEATREPVADKWITSRNVMGLEYFVGHWLGDEPVAFDDANRKIEPAPCADCGATTRRWDHIARVPVCWDCSESKKRKRQDREAYRAKEAAR